MQIEAKRKRYLKKQKKIGIDLFPIEQIRNQSIILLVAFIPFADILLYFSIPIYWYFIVFAVILTAVYLMKTNTDYQLQPYRRTNNFISIYSRQEFREHVKEYQEKAVPRTYEVKHLAGLVDKVCAATGNKPVICVTGESGSGKSTIIELLLDKLGDAYQLYDLSEQYGDLEHVITSKFRVETYEEAVEAVRHAPGKILLLFDQFEVFFFQDGEEQHRFFHSFLAKLTGETLVCLFAVKREYFLDFFSSVNYCNVSRPRKEARGILRYYPQPSGVPQDNSSILFYAPEEKDSQVEGNRKNSIYKRCTKAFGNGEGRVIYAFIKDSKIIEQQILLTVLEHERNNIHVTRELLTSGKEQLIHRYFEQQLGSTGYFFEATQVLYLLSYARKFNLQLTDKQIMRGIVHNLGEDNRFDSCLNQLRDLGLVRKLDKDGIKYDVVHDYISDQFLTYAAKEMSPRIRNIMDTFITNIQNVGFTSHIDDVLERKSSSHGVLHTAFALSVAAILIFTFVRIQVFDSDFHPVLVIPMASSIYYGYRIYLKIFSNQTRRTSRFASILFMVAIPLILVLLAFYFYWQCYVFIGLAIISLGLGIFLVSQTNKLVKNADDLFRTFGVKEICAGILVCLIGYVILYYDTFTVWGVELSTMTIATLLFMVVILYGYIAQLNKSYYLYCVGMLLNKKEFHS